jgi:hypothetical protein
LLTGIKNSETEMILLRYKKTTKSTREKKFVANGGKEEKL